MSSVGRWSCTSPVWCDVDTTRLRKRTGPRSTGVNSIASGEALARPAAVLRVGGGEVPVDLGEVDVEAPAGRRQLAPAADRAADGEDDHERDEHADDDCEPGRHAQ